jgi:hypothetical protein
MTRIKAASRLAAAGFLSAALGLVAIDTEAFAQAGSTGGTIGKTDKSESGGGPPSPAEAQPRKPSGASRNAPASSCSRMPGSWSWFNGITVVIRPDGTASGGPHTASWSCANGSVVMRWSHGYTDRLNLSQDGTHLQGTNGFVPVSGSRR